MGIELIAPQSYVYPEWVSSLSSIKYKIFENAFALPHFSLPNRGDGRLEQQQQKKVG